MLFRPLTTIQNEEKTMIILGFHITRTMESVEKLLVLGEMNISNAFIMGIVTKVLLLLLLHVQAWFLHILEKI